LVFNGGDGHAWPDRIVSALGSNGSVRAAQYLRMSTEHQLYSPDNQRNAIAEYAQQHGFTIVAS
jgi:Resolvase, N terminal domain